jgi:3-hydroxyisobutyrate dehydrogenase
MTRVAFLGLGVMGFPMARHLQQKGHDVCVYNRTAAKSAAWVAAHGGSSAATPALAAADRDIVFMCVGNDDDIRSVVFGPDGALAGMKPGSVLVDHTTASATIARELDVACSAVGVGFVDGPVSGGQAGAENGALTVMCGGSSAHFASVSPVIESFAKSVKLLGPAGSGQLTKMVNQICIAGLVQGLAEGIQFAQKAGLDPSAVIDAISKGAAQSWQMENRSSTMARREFDFGFAVEWMRKDLGICLDEARRNGSVLPITSLIDQFFGEVVAMGGKRWDTSSLIARLD